MQQYSCPDVVSGGKYGLVFPELNLLEARTGRFSSSNPNIQNIPKRDKEFAKLCRAMFTCTKRDSKWYSLDWSNQEGRLQLHYAVLKDFKGSRDWLSRFLDNPKVDTHSIVAEMMGGVPRDTAKTIYLGKSFCMGRAKTAKRLGLPTEIVETDRGQMLTSGKEATKLIEKYEEAFPYLTELQKDCMKVIKDRGYITTIGGRKCQRPPQIKGKEYDYKAISLLIQGSAADQMYHALTIADQEGIDIKCIVHDEFNIEGTREDALKMKQIMETCVKMKVPSVAEVKEGTSWGDIKEIKDDSRFEA
jgi:DNA polymerase-1